MCRVKIPFTVERIVWPWINDDKLFNFVPVFFPLALIFVCWYFHI